MNYYEINDETMAVIPIGENETRVVELNREYVVKKKAYCIMDESCQFYGSTYKGRLKAAKSILNCSYKLPILIEESTFLIFFPIKSSLEEDCVWINLSKIKEVKKVNSKTNIIFENGKNITVNTSKISIDNQIYRSSRLENMLRKRIETKKRG